MEYYTNIYAKIRAYCTLEIVYKLCYNEYAGKRV